VNPLLILKLILDSVPGALAAYEAIRAALSEDDAAELERQLAEADRGVSAATARLLASIAAQAAKAAPSVEE
jgi:hypothetical protein